MAIFYLIERSNNDPHRPGNRVFATFPLGATLWLRDGPGFPWVDDVLDARKFRSREEAETHRAREWADDPVLAVTEHGWIGTASSSAR